MNSIYAEKPFSINELCEYLSLLNNPRVGEPCDRLLGKIYVKNENQNISIDFKTYEGPALTPCSIQLPYPELHRIFNELSQMEISNTSLYNENYYECLVHMNLKHVEEKVRPETLKIDKSRGIKYQFSYTSSDIFFLHFLRAASEFGVLKKSMDQKRYDLILRYHSRNSIDFLSNPRGSLKPLFETLSHLSYPFITLKIRSEKKKSLSDFRKLSKSFLFQMAYSLSVSFIDLQSFEDAFETYASLKPRGSGVADVSFPSVYYKADMLDYYQTAIATNIPMLQFLSFYQVLEQPFEYIRKEMILAGVKSVNERDVLPVVIKKYVNFSRLKVELLRQDPTLLNYYEQKEVKFLNTGKVDFSTDDLASKTIAKRIYETRNSIVHGKETDKPRYFFLRNIEGLRKEIPLIRFLAEELIQNNSEQIPE